MSEEPTKLDFFRENTNVTDEQLISRLHEGLTEIDLS